MYDIYTLPPPPNYLCTAGPVCLLYRISTARKEKASSQLLFSLRPAGWVTYCSKCVSTKQGSKIFNSIVRTINITHLGYNLSMVYFFPPPPLPPPQYIMHVYTESGRGGEGSFQSSPRYIILSTFSRLIASILTFLRV